MSLTISPAAPASPGGGGGGLPAGPTTRGDYALDVDDLGVRSWVTRPVFDTVAVQGAPLATPDAGQAVLYYQDSGGRPLLATAGSYLGDAVPVGIQAASMALLDDRFEGYGSFLPDNPFVAAQLQIAVPLGYNMALDAVETIAKTITMTGPAGDKSVALSAETVGDELYFVPTDVFSVSKGIVFGGFNVDEPPSPMIVASVGWAGNETAFISTVTEGVVGNGNLTVGWSTESNPPLGRLFADAATINTSMATPEVYGDPLTLRAGNDVDGYHVLTIDAVQAALTALDPDAALLPGAALLSVDGAYAIAFANDHDALSLARSADDPSAFAFDAPVRVDGYVWGDLFYANDTLGQAAFVLRNADTGDVYYKGLLGSGSPEGVAAANPGSEFTDITNGDLYVKHTGTGATGWKLVLLTP